MGVQFPHLPPKIMNPFLKNVKEDKSSYPVFLEYEIPEEFLNMTWNQLKSLSKEDFFGIMERMRLWILDMYHNHNVNALIHPKSADDIKSGFTKFMKMDVTKYYYSNGVKALYGSSNKWSSGVNNWFPEMLGVETAHSWPASVIDFLSRKDYFHLSMEKIILQDTLKVYSKNPDRPLFGPLRKMLKIARGTQIVTNFPTHVAKWLYINYLSQYNDKTLYVYDPCMGWAGRMISLFAASTHITLHDKKIELIGTDVNTDVHERFDQIYRFWNTYVSSLKSIKVNKYVVPAEDMHTVKEFKKLYGKGHLAFTSPPYFDKEHYSNDDTQSYIRYGTYDEWRDGFLYGMMKDTYDYLRPGATFLLNVANTRPKRDGSFIAPIENDAVRLGESLGFRYDGKYHLLLSLMAGKGNKTNKNIITVEGVEWKFEPIHIFIKL